ncbi:putative disease resistance protein RF9 [Vitis vinifera]|uniref:Putative disease resistance protein RF9 n=1 Tax=Vitis vinifera TaxID=29760 RepID=A0A438BQG0_VITVI|nr:putative disease resistance protein RF9 [Vitis vinifera]
MENLRYLFLWYDKKVGKPLQIDTLRNLQTLSGIYFSDWQQNDTSGFTSLRKLKIKVDDVTVAEFSNSIAKLANLRSLYLEAVPPNFIIPCFVMNSWLHLSKLLMKGSIPMLPKAHEFPPSLTQLTLENIRLGHGHMMILEKLPKLLIFRLRRMSKYLEEEMQVSSDGFPQLKILQLSGFRTSPRLLIINKGGMPKLTHLQIFECYFNIDGLGELLHLRKVDVNVAYHRWISSLPYPSEWHKIRRHTGLNKGAIHFHYR